MSFHVKTLVRWESIRHYEEVIVKMLQPWPVHKDKHIALMNKQEQSIKYRKIIPSLALRSPGVSSKGKENMKKIKSERVPKKTYSRHANMSPQNPYCKIQTMLYNVTVVEQFKVPHDTAFVLQSPYNRSQWKVSNSFFKHDLDSNRPRYCSQKFVNTSFTVFSNIAFCLQWF